MHIAVPKTRPLGLALLALLLVACSDPHLRRSEESIRDGYLEVVPLGTEKEGVEAFIEDLAGHQPKQIFPIPDLRVGYSFETKDPASYYVVELGSYGWIQDVHVRAFFVLDEGERLVEVAVVKAYEGF